MRSGRDGVMDLPVKLAVCFLILGLMVPVLMQSVDYADDEISSDTIRMEASDLKKALVKAYYSGGTIIRVDMHLDPGHALAVGGDGGDGYSIRMIIDGREIGREYLDRPVFAVIGSESVISGDMTIGVVATGGPDAGVSVIL